jgi:hypothetical protein
MTDEVVDGLLRRGVSMRSWHAISLAARADNSKNRCR